MNIPNLASFHQARRWAGGIGEEIAEASKRANIIGTTPFMDFYNFKEG
jgi:hypothetical protein